MIRHIDDLGRFVIPKEIRRRLGIHRRDAIDITEMRNHIILEKYDATPKFTAVHKFIELIKQVFDFDMAVVLNERVIAHTLLGDVPDKRFLDMVQPYVHKLPSYRFQAANKYRGKTIMGIYPFHGLQVGEGAFVILSKDLKSPPAEIVLRFFKAVIQDTLAC